MRGDFFFVAVLFLGVCTTSQAERPEAPEQTCYWVGDSIEAEEAIRAKLAENIGSVGFGFNETPLEKVVDYLEDNYGLNIYIHEFALDELGISKEEPFSFNLSNISLGTAIKKLLEPLDLTYRLENELLVITSIDEATYQLRIAIYPVADLVWAEESNSLHYEALIDTIILTVAPETWAENGGGEAEIASYSGLLIISQAEQVHYQIKNYLNAIRRCKKYHIAKPETEVATSASSYSSSGAFTFGGFSGSASSASAGTSK